MKSKVNINCLATPIFILDQQGNILSRNTACEINHITKYIKDNILNYTDIDLALRGTYRAFFRVDNKILPDHVYIKECGDTLIFEFFLPEDYKQTRLTFFELLADNIKSPIDTLIRVVSKDKMNSKDIFSIKKCCSKLASIANDVSDYSKIEKNDMTVKNRVFKMAEVTDFVEFLFDIKIQVHQEVPEYIYSDQGLLTQILLKINELFKVSETVVTKENNRLVFKIFSVEDIDDRILSILSGEMISSFTGLSGIGMSMYVCKKVCLSMGGDISGDTKHIEFYITLDNLDINYQDLHGKNVVVYVNSHTSRMSISLEMMKMNVMPIIALTAKDADYAVKNNNISMVITDNDEYISKCKLPCVKLN